MKGESNPKNSKKRYVLDTSAVLTLRGDEEGADHVENLLRQAESGIAEVYGPFMMYMEAYYRVWQVEGETSARTIYAELKALPIQQVNLTEPILMKAGAIKAQYSLSVADAWIIATAIEVQGILVHKDPEMEQAQQIVDLLQLPYKKSEK
jgi:predicted nucleic acid-binding protein